MNFSHMRRQMHDMDRMMTEPFAMMNSMNSMMNQMMGSPFGRQQPMLGFDPMMMQQHPQQHQQHQQRQHYRDPMAMDLFWGPWRIWWWFDASDAACRQRPQFSGIFAINVDNDGAWWKAKSRFK